MPRAHRESGIFQSMAKLRRYRGMQRWTSQKAASVSGGPPVPSRYACRPAPRILAGYRCTAHLERTTRVTIAGEALGADRVGGLLVSRLVASCILSTRRMKTHLSNICAYGAGPWVLKPARHRASDLPPFFLRILAALRRSLEASSYGTTSEAWLACMPVPVKALA